MIEKGIIIKSTGDRYQVKSASGEQFICRARGKFRLGGLFPLVGDKVNFRRNTKASNNDESDEYLIDEILHRSNRFTRPPVANVDMMLIAASVAPPVTEKQSIDILCAVAAHNEIDVVLCLTKTDIGDSKELSELYRKAGYRVFETSAATGEGTEKLKTALENSISVITGCSGVGKSSLLNRLLGSDIKTSEISKKVGRGKHTTRHTELYELGDNGYIIDTPGFSSVDPIKMLLYDKNELQYLFPEFASHLHSCRYDDCSHTGEDGCVIGDAVVRGEIAESRYGSYKSMYNQLKDIKEWQLKGLREGEEKGFIL